MLSDSGFRKTARCSHYKNFLFSKDRTIPEFPIKRISSSDVNATSMIKDADFNKPFIIADVSPQLGLRLPDPSFELVDIAQIVGYDMPIKIIEVAQQSEIVDWSLGDYADYLKNRTQRHKVLNMISLEFSTTPLNAKVQSPQFVRDIDWIDVIWPMDRRARGDYPKVQKYCLAGMAGSYTDFHIDFGGTSVWYHILHGQKRFYLVAPTTENLRAFEQWSNSKSQSETFFGDCIAQGHCFRFDLNPGETFVIPSGWIHAVYTPKDSLVFGGNFVHSFSILRQLQVYAIEQRTRVQKAYRFPYFRQINWYFLCFLLKLAQERYARVTPETCSDVLLPDGTAGGSTDDDEEEDDELSSLCKHIIDASLFNQLPYLVKSCEGWIASMTEQYEKQLFHTVAVEEGFQSPASVIYEWWKLLLHIATLLPVLRLHKQKRASHLTCSSNSRAVRVNGESEDNEGNEVGSSASCGDAWEVLHVKRIKELQVLDVLDEAVVAGALPTFDNDMREVLQMSKGSTDRRSYGDHQSQSSQQQQQQQHQLDQVRQQASVSLEDAGGAISPRESSEKAPSNGQPRLVLKLSRKPATSLPSSLPASHKADDEVNDKHNKDEDDDDMLPNEPPSHIDEKQRRDREKEHHPQAQAKKREDVSFNPPARLNILGSSRLDQHQQQQQLPLAKENAAGDGSARSRSIDAEGAGDVGGGSRAKDITHSSNSRYSTRGKKLSAEFLRDALDVEVTGTDTADAGEDADAAVVSSNHCGGGSAKHSTTYATAANQSDKGDNDAQFSDENDSDEDFDGAAAAAASNGSVDDDDEYLSSAGSDDFDNGGDDDDDWEQGGGIDEDDGEDIIVVGVGAGAGAGTGSADDRHGVLSSRKRRRQSERASSNSAAQRTGQLSGKPVFSAHASRSTGGARRGSSSAGGMRPRKAWMSDSHGAPISSTFRVERMSENVRFAQHQQQYHQQQQQQKQQEPTAAGALSGDAASRPSQQAPRFAINIASGSNNGTWSGGNRGGADASSRAKIMKKLGMK